MQRSRYPVSGVETRHSTCWTGHFADETRATAGRIVAATAAMRAADRETRDATVGMSCFRSRDTTLNLLDGTFHGRNTSNSRQNRRCNRRNACCRPRNKRCNGRDVLFQESGHDTQPAGRDISRTKHEQQPAESLLQPPQCVLPTAKQEVQRSGCPVSGVETRLSTCWTGHFMDGTRATAGRIVVATAATRTADRETRDSDGEMRDAGRETGHPASETEDSGAKTRHPAAR